MSGDFRVILDDEEMKRYLDSLDEKGVIKILRSATVRAGTVLRNAMRPEVPVKKRSGAGTRGSFKVRRKGGLVDREYGTPGEMRASVSARRIKRTDAIGVVVGPMGKRAFMRHWIAYGTRPHEIRPKGVGGFLRVGGGFVPLVHHPGSKPNDYAGRAESRAGDTAFSKAEDYLWERTR